MPTPKAPKKGKGQHTLESLNSEMSAVFQQLNASVPDMAIAVVAAAYLEKTMMAMLKKRLVCSEVVVAGVKETPSARFIPAPGEFARCAALCYGSGLLGPATYAMLHLIGKIRNEFAHGHLPKSFEGDEIAPLVDSLWELQQVKPRQVVIRRHRFTASSALLMAHIHLRALEIQQIHIAKDLRIATTIEIH